LAFKVKNFPAHYIEFERIKIFDSELSDRELMLGCILENAITNMHLKYLVVPLESSNFISTEVEVSFQAD
jgi:hypothetical protein